ncbi:MAG: TetR/AcrR family transcriptional regulator [Proteobacteria bacterium]|nr:TetR/AcrR family transcriptional regulator [Pseudomonadota bacterium]
MATQQQRSETTRAQLLKAFRASFLKKGLEATTTHDVLLSIGLSKGAMYHHFRSKTDIAQAIYEAESHGAIERSMQKVAHLSSPLERLKGACLSWMEEVQTPDISRILFDIGPSALGMQKARAIEDSVSLVLMERELEAAIAVGEIGEGDVKLIAALLNALVAEAALYSLRTGKETVPSLRKSIDALFVAFKK